MTAFLATSVLVIAVVVLGGWAYLTQQRTARLLSTSRVVTESLAESSRLRGQGQEAADGGLAKLTEALGAAKRAKVLLNEGECDDALRNRVAVALADLESEYAAAGQRVTERQRDRVVLLERLETIRAEAADHFDWKRVDAELQAAFRTLAIDADKLVPEEAGKQGIATRSAPLELAFYVDSWVNVRRRVRGSSDPSWRSLLAVAKVADPDPWRNNLRELVGQD